MKLTLDIENTTLMRDGRHHLDPFEHENSLVMVGLLQENGTKHIVTFDHIEKDKISLNNKDLVQSYLDKATMVIGHNIAYDLVWLWESGFKYDGLVFDTMIAEYVLQRGQKQPLSLEACAERYLLKNRKQGTLKEYYKKGFSTRDIPYEELAEYLEHDIKSTKELYDVLNNKLNEPLNKGLQQTVELSNEVCMTLAKIYKRGFKVNKETLETVRDEFNKERKKLIIDLQVHVHELMGDTPINLNSPEQLSWVIYSRKPHDKTDWQNSYNPYMKENTFRDIVNKKTKIVYKTKAKQCPSCKGHGKYRKTKKDGTPFANETKCPTCLATGFLFDNTNEVAGLKFKAPNAKWASANGFTTSKINIAVLERISKEKGMDTAYSFLSKVRRLSAVETYLSSFIDGISSHIKQDGMLHVKLLQHRTSTGRLSGANPNMQNMPRGGTFPVKKVFVSRWEGGKILEADFAQLEFRVAAFLSQDETAIKEIKEGFDVHSYTAKVITDAGQPTSRQDSKQHTFAPLYGATGFGRTKAEATYYERFIEKYKGVASWHGRLAQQALDTSTIKIPSGREFRFNNVYRLKNNSITNFTQIKNYPVQSFATADCVLLCLVYMDKLLKDKQSCIVNTVHDSIVIDIHPNEIDEVIQVINDTNSNLKSLIDNKWNIDFNVPLLLEAKIGNNWLDTKDIL